MESLKKILPFVLMLGMCPTLAVTTSAMNGMGNGTYDDGGFNYVEFCYFST